MATVTVTKEKVDLIESKAKMLALYKEVDRFTEFYDTLRDLDRLVSEVCNERGIQSGDR